MQGLVPAAIGHAQMAGTLLGVIGCKRAHTCAAQRQHVCTSLS